MTGDGDTQVAPLHARKMAALLQADTPSNRPILLGYELKAGHSAGRSVPKTIDQLTDQLSLLQWQLVLHAREPSGSQGSALINDNER
jgi:prolyl oligopeptidase